jgi:O-antigen/teichoic acid export membrane protein
MKAERLTLLVLVLILSGLFLGLGFFVFIIFKSDFLDWHTGRLTDLQVFKDVILLGWWLALFSLIKYIYKQFRQK